MDGMEIIQLKSREKTSTCQQDNRSLCEMKENLQRSESKKRERTQNQIFHLSFIVAFVRTFVKFVKRKEKFRIMQQCASATCDII